MPTKSTEAPSRTQQHLEVEKTIRDFRKRVKTLAERSVADEWAYPVIDFLADLADDADALYSDVLRLVDQGQLKLPF